MRIIGSREIWNEPFADLVIRWFRRQPESFQAEFGGPADLIGRIERRALRVIDFCALEPARALKSLREWETRWNGREQWNRLSAHAAHLGWRVLREEGAGHGASLTQATLGATGAQVIVIAEEPLRQQLAHARENGCLLPLTGDDLATVTLAREIYALETQRMGKPPQEWVEEVAQHEFARRLLGLPFHPLVFALIDGS